MICLECLPKKEGHFFKIKILIGKSPQEQLTQRLVKVSIFSDIWNTTGHRPEQGSLVDPSLIRGFEQEIPSRLNYSEILWNANFKFL